MILIFDYVRTLVIDSANVLLPYNMKFTDEARAMVLTVGLQESGFRSRRQSPGPGRSFWMYEPGATSALGGVMKHKSTKDAVADICKTLGYKFDRAVLYAAVEHNDTLACALARMLLFTLPDALPQESEHEIAWKQYLEAWNPGKPKPQSWNTFFDRAWEAVNSERSAP